MTAIELTPILNVSDFDASVTWFEKVGFTPGFRWSDTDDAPATFGAVLWGNIEIFLCVDAQGGRGDNGAWMSIFVDDVDAVTTAVHAPVSTPCSRPRTSRGVCASSASGIPTAMSSGSAPARANELRSGRPPLQERERVAVGILEERHPLFRTGRPELARVVAVYEMR